MGNLSRIENKEMEMHQHHTTTTTITKDCVWVICSCIDLVWQCLNENGNDGGSDVGRYDCMREREAASVSVCVCDHFEIKKAAEMV